MVPSVRGGVLFLSPALQPLRKVPSLPCLSPDSHSSCLGLRPLPHNPSLSFSVQPGTSPPEKSAPTALRSRLSCLQVAGARMMSVCPGDERGVCPCEPAAGYSVCGSSSLACVSVLAAWLCPWSPVGMLVWVVCLFRPKSPQSTDIVRTPAPGRRQVHKCVFIAAVPWQVGRWGVGSRLGAGPCQGKITELETQ